MILHVQPVVSATAEFLQLPVLAVVIVSVLFVSIPAVWSVVVSVVFSVAERGIRSFSGLSSCGFPVGVRAVSLLTGAALKVSS